MKTHLLNGSFWTWCGRKGPFSATTKLTTDPKQTTCQTCQWRSAGMEATQ